MKKGLKHIAIVYLLTAVVFASSGFQLFSSFCNCTKETTVSVFSPKDCCNDACKLPASTASIKSKCCKQSSISFKTEQYLPTYSELSVKVTGSTLLYNIIPSVTVTEPKTNNSRIEFGKPPLPLLYGKAMLCRFHSLKIPCA